MSIHERSAEQIRADNIAAMGTELGELFTVLSFELTWLLMVWKQYVFLYGGGQRRLDLLNRTASMFFGLVQGTLWDETLLAITRLAGPVQSLSKDNLTVKRLPTLISNKKLSAGIRTNIEALVTRAAAAFDQRNRYIAHRDLALSLGRALKPISLTTEQEVDEILDAIASVLNAIELHYCRSTTAYRMSLMTNDAETLLYFLRAGVHREDLRIKYLEKGEIRPEDWEEDNDPL